jgi:hypothetical protein
MSMSMSMSLIHHLPSTHIHSQYTHQ